MTEPTKSLGECVRDGMNYLEQGRFDEALREFRERNPDENSLISYGIATAFFRKALKEGSLDLAAVNEVIMLYEKSLVQRDGESSTYFMAAYAYEARAGFLAAQNKSLPEVLAALTKAHGYFETSCRISPHFRTLCGNVIPTLKEKIEELRQHYS